ncbi:MAG: helix-turn-helix domain-containing protein [Bacteroidetes bacterium]|nr:helix-turn-helix domain-containing protein [Bacteroidota bacterium]
MENKVKNISEEQVKTLLNIEAHLLAKKTVLNIDEVCRFTGLSKSHVYKLTCYHKIPFFKKSKHLFFDRIEVENWLMSSRQ